MTQDSPSEGTTRAPEGRTPEQHAAVRRRALPVAVAALALGLLSALWPLTVHVAAFTPPNIYAVNMAFCALLMGAGIVFYARGTPGTRTATIASVAAIVLGLAGTLVYTRQAITSRMAREALELENVRAIAVAAQSYATKHAGTYPADLLVMLEEQDLKPEALQSPYGQRNPLFDDFAKARASQPRPALLKAVLDAADYEYFGADLKTVPDTLAPNLLVASSKYAVMRSNLAVSFADTKGRFITDTEAPDVMKACNAARTKMGLDPIKPPTAVQAPEPTTMPK